MKNDNLTRNKQESFCMIYVVICKDKFSIFVINLYFIHASQQIKVSVLWFVSYKSHLKTESLTAAALLKNDELILFGHDIMTIIRKIKNQHQRVDTNNIHKKIIKIPDYRAFTKEYLNIRMENLLKMVESKVSLIEAVTRLLWMMLR